MDKRLTDAQHRSYAWPNNRVTEAGTNHSDGSMDTGTLQNDNSDWYHHNNFDSLSSTIGLPCPVQGQFWLDQHAPRQPLYNRSTSSSSSRRTAGEGTSRAPADTAPTVPRPFTWRSYNRNPNQQTRQSPQQLFWRNNLQSAQTTVTLANRWIVHLLHILLETVRASAASAKLPDIHLLHHLPVFQSVQGLYIRKPLFRQKCSPDNMKDEEEALKQKKGVTQTSIKEVLEEINLLRDIYNKQVTTRPQGTPRPRQSNPPFNNNNSKKATYMDKTSPVRGHK